MVAMLVFGDNSSNLQQLKESQREETYVLASTVNLVSVGVNMAIQSKLAA
jgi:hypothetical protein